MADKDNQEIVEILDRLKEEKTQELADQAMKALAGINVFIPAVMPKDTPQEILDDMTSQPNTPRPIPEGAQPQPCVIQNGEGQKYFAVFTSEEEMTRNEDFPRYPITINIPFNAFMDKIVIQSERIKGVVVNPFSHNFVMNIDKEATAQAREMAKQSSEPQKIKLTPAQFHAIIRQSIESTHIPKKLFAEGEEFVNDLRERQGECLMEFFEEPYSHGQECPYTADDFEFMSLFISDTLQLTRITMPTSNLYPGNAVTLFITWNPEEKTACYFGVLKGRNGEFDKLMEMTADGQGIDHGDAPSEGSELQLIIDLVNSKAGK